jgi:glutathione S-transferase
MTMYTLYWARNSANMVCHAALIETGVPFKLVELDVDKGEHKSSDYLKLNPNARVPTMIEDGRVMYESAAILLYLCEKHPQAGLMPPVGSPQRAAFLQWLFYLTNTVQEALMNWWHADNYLDKSEEQTALVAGAERRLARMWQLLDSQVAAAGPYLLGEDCTAVDMFLTMVAHWSRKTARPARGYANIGKLMALVEARPSWQKMMADEGNRTI